MRINLNSSKLILLALLLSSVEPAYAINGENIKSIIEWMIRLTKIYGGVLLFWCLAFGVWIIASAIIKKVGERPIEDFSMRLSVGFMLLAVGGGVITKILSDMKLLTSDF